MSEPISGDVNQPTGATIPPAPGEKSRADYRDLKCTLPGMEFGALRWAAMRCLRDLPNGKRGCMTLAEFFQAALRDKVRATVRDEIARGKSIPPDIAAVIDEKRGV